VSASTDPLISTEELARRLHEPGLRVLDASWSMDGADHRVAFEAGHIPGARRFDLEGAAQPDAPLSHTLASESHFAAFAAACGVSNGDEVVIYDATGMSPSARAWWMFKVQGHHNVRVLDGGLAKWTREGRKIEQGRETGGSGSFAARRVPHRLADMASVREAVRAGAQVVDARPAARFAGDAPEPRAGLRSGHIPGSVNLPWSRLVDATTGAFVGVDEAAALFRQAGIDPSRAVVCTCGSGVTACVLALNLERIGNTEVAVYDGSWSEWATHQPA
jgi:thiosulfate/3-mercaptopyruvate sulfurtransferase